MVNILLWLVVGGLAGWVGSKIMKTDAQMGIFLNIVVGIIGAFIGGFVMNMLTGASYDTFSIAGFLVAVLGSVILLGIVKLITGRKLTA